MDYISENEASRSRRVAKPRMTFDDIWNIDTQNNKNVEILKLW